MVNFCLKEEEKNLLKSLIGKKLIKYRHDPLDKFGGETVYGRVELFFEDVIILIDYDYQAYPLFGNTVDDHPKFAVKIIKEEEAISALQDTCQINIKFDEILTSIILVEEYTNVEWDGKKDDVRILTAIIFKFGNKEIALQGDYMIPLLDIFKSENSKEKLIAPGNEFNQPDTKFETVRKFIELKY